MRLVNDILNGERLQLARLLTEIENDTPTGQKALDILFTHTGKAILIGITGAPGTGKSSLANRLAYEYRHPGDGSPPKKVAIVAVDPSSPFSGGALLGDRIRMKDLAGDPDVFIRSMSSRGHQGGLARTTSNLVHVLDAAGFEIILIETVGAGQAEVEIARLSPTTIVVDAPGLGDEIQAIKAGILEIADILVVNKFDQPGAEQTEQYLRAMVEMIASPRHEDDPKGAWVPPIVRTVATNGIGLAELHGEITRHRKYLEMTGGLEDRMRSHFENEIVDRVKERLLDRWRHELSENELSNTLQQVYRREMSPNLAATHLTEAPAKEKCLG